MLIRIFEENPNPRYIHQIVKCLKNGGVIIIPTDTIYSFACDITKPKAIERMAQIKSIKLKDASFSLLCQDLSHLSDFTRPIPNTIYKTMRRVLPGPYTFILNANNNVPKLFQSKRKTVGIRVPDNNIVRSIIEELGNPITSTSIHDDDEIVEYTTDPELINEKYANIVEIIVDGGYGDNEASTILDCTDDEPIVIREGKGSISNI